jgi:hypothetical protein
MRFFLLVLAPLLLAAGAPGKTAKLKAPPAAPIEKVPYSWDIPNAHDSISVPSTLEANGVPVRLSAVKSTWKVADLLPYIADSFFKHGLYVPPVRHQLQLVKEPTVTALDHVRMISYTAIFQSNPDGTTTVIMGEANVGKRRKPSDKHFAPIFPGAGPVVTADVEGARTLNYTAKTQSSEVMKFYKDVLAKEGYSEKEPGTFQKQAQEIRVIAQPVKDGDVSVAVIGRAAPETGASSPH